MKITKNLKYATFEWDDADKTFTIIDKDENAVVLNKVYSFAFMRFVIRMAQRNWFRKVIKEKIENKIEDEQDEDPKDQMAFWLAEEPF